MVLDRIACLMLWPDCEVSRERAVESCDINQRVDAAEIGQTRSWSLGLDDAVAKVLEAKGCDQSTIDSARSLINPPKREPLSREELEGLLSRAVVSTPLRDVLKLVPDRKLIGQRVGTTLLRLLGISGSAGAELPSQRSLRGYYKRSHGVSPSQQAKEWKEFRSVRHLWAATAVLHVGYLRANQPLDFPCALHDLEGFLTAADATRVVGEAAKFHGGDSPYILTPGTAWRLPSLLEVGLRHLTQPKIAMLRAMYERRHSLRASHARRSKTS
jgi:hypothetical protein